jgi:hypothetical protein
MRHQPKGSKRTLPRADTCRIVGPSMLSSSEVDILRVLSFLNRQECKKASTSCRFMQYTHIHYKNACTAKGLFKNDWISHLAPSWFTPAVLLQTATSFSNWQSTTHVRWLPGGDGSRGAYLVLTAAGPVVVKPGSACSPGLSSGHQCCC